MFSATQILGQIMSLLKILLTVVISFTILISQVAAQETNNVDENLQKSRAVIQELHASLSKEFSIAIKEGEIEKAIDICHKSAQGITNSFKTDNQSIRRVSLKIRNPKNIPDSYEHEKLMQIERDKIKGKLQTEYYEVTEESGVQYFRYLSPIIIKPPCLSCHGEKGKLSPAVLKAIEGKYPKDKAIDYRSGDMRGAFSLKIKQ